jgi:5-methylcytosine-specific restriction endonuclease McrA
VVDSYSVSIRSATAAFPLPSVLRCKVFVPPRISEGRVPLNRKNVLLRDNYSCQYCGVRGGGLTMDHVVPVSK